MGQLPPIALADGATIYIESTDDTATPRGDIVRGTPYDDNAPRGPVIIGDPPKQIAQTFEAIEHTVRAYTTYTLQQTLPGVAGDSQSSTVSATSALLLDAESAQTRVLSTLALVTDAGMLDELSDEV